METTTAAMEKPVPGRKAQSSSSAFPVALLQRKCACGGTATSAPQGECEECRKKKLQRRAADFREMADVPPIVEEVLDSSGQPLDSATREFMEPRFGHDFSRVRVHTDHKASESAKAVNALAYTVGHNVVFAGGQYAPGKKSGQKLLAHELTHVVQQRKMASAAPQSKLEIGPANDSLEQEADRFAEKVAGVSATATAPPPTPPAGSSNGSRPLLQRAPADQSIPATAPKVAAPGLIVDDEVQELADGQMHKTEFLDKLHAEICSTAESALKPAGRTATGCPFIEKWITRLRGQTSQHVERAIRKYAPESSGAKNAADYIPPVGAKVQEGVSRWAATGEISGVPPELMAEAMGGGILGAIGSALSGLVTGIGGALSSVGHLFTKANPGGARAGDPIALQTQLNSSNTARPLESGVKSRMEAAFGHSFDRVRVHADSGSAQLSSNLNARAFTVGRDVAFAAGEYQPGTLLGDALIAHELAHVMQQDDGAAGPMAKGGTEYDSLEEDADISAVSAMASLWSGARGSLKEIGKNAMPRLRSGLKLQRCSCSYNTRNDPADQKDCCEKYMKKELVAVRSSALPKVQSAHNQLTKSPKSVAQQLQSHFLVQPNDEPNVKLIAGQLQLMADAMRSGDNGAQFFCRDANDQVCRNQKKEPLYGLADNCSSSSKKIFFCGDYDHEPFLKGGHWEQTMIHEYAHIGCSTANMILPAGSEFYKGQPGSAYPGPDPATAVKNADSYANFTLDVAAGMLPGGSIPHSPINEMTAWELSLQTPSAFAQAPNPAAAGGATQAPSVKDYQRASGFLKALFSKYHIPFDPDLDQRVLGRDATDAEIATVDQLLDQLLRVPGVSQATVQSPAARPMPSGPKGPSLRGKVRVLENDAEFMIKRYQLQYLVAGVPKSGPDVLQRDVRSMWKELGTQPAENAVITEQEIRGVSLIAFVSELTHTPGFYSPIDDKFYLSPGSNLSNKEVQSTARHETLHLLAGREITRKAFAKRFGSPQYIRYWSPFEEGMAELINMEAERPKSAPVCSPGLPQTKSEYGPSIDLMCELIQRPDMGRDLVFNAYFSGNIPDNIFDFLVKRIP